MTEPCARTLELLLLVRSAGVSESRFVDMFVDPSPEEENFGLAIQRMVRLFEFLRYVKSSAGSCFVGNVVALVSRDVIVSV